MSSTSEKQGHLENLSSMTTQQLEDLKTRQLKILNNKFVFVSSTLEFLRKCDSYVFHRIIPLRLLSNRWAFLKYLEM